MYYCRKCGFSLTGTAQQCPFCQNELVGEPEEEDVFPYIPFKEKPHWLLIRLLALGSIIAAGACMAVNVSLPKSGKWSLFVAAGLVSVWISGGIACRKRSNLPKAVFWQICIDSLLTLAWDYWTGFWGWSVNFVLPVLYSCSLLAMFLLIHFMKLPPQDCLFYLILNILLGFVPLILLLCNVLWVPYPSAICLFVSIVSLAILLLFHGKELMGELERRFHL